MPEPEHPPDVNAVAAFALIQAENDYRSALVGPFPRMRFRCCRGANGGWETGEAVPPNAAGEPGR